jgi:hypothetical protein
MGHEAEVMAMHLGSYDQSFSPVCGYRGGSSTNDFGFATTPVAERCIACDRIFNERGGVLGHAELIGFGLLNVYRVTLGDDARTKVVVRASTEAEAIALARAGLTIDPYLMRSVANLLL